MYLLKNNLGENYMRGGNVIPRYISLISLTQKGIENIKESPARLDQVKAVFKAMGAELKEFYLVTD
jgi:uncharacterized protein with GYD domain